MPETLPVRLLPALLLLALTGAALAQLAPTPAQTEGPYYPVEKPADRDADLTRVADGPVAMGEVLLLEGRLLDTGGAAIAGATIEIWQTDAGGVYLHPRDPGVANRDPAFQSYGEAVTDPDGRWVFRTVLPGLYGTRPAHIHLKVLVDGREALTSQIYFAGDPRLERDPVLRGADAALLTAELEPATDADGTEVLRAEHDLVLRR